MGRRPHPLLTGMGDPCSVILDAPAHIHVIVISFSYQQKRKKLCLDMSMVFLPKFLELARRRVPQPSVD